MNRTARRTSATASGTLNCALVSLENIESDAITNEVAEVLKGVMD